MDIVAIVLPILSNYYVANYCPLTRNFDSAFKSESEQEKLYRTNAWPILSGTIGFAWYLSRNKSVDAHTLTKGSQRLNKLFQNSHKYMIDIAFIILVVMLNLWTYYYSCNQMYTQGFYVIMGTIASLLWVIYLVGANNSSTLLLLTPLLLWLLVTAQTVGMQYYTAVPPKDELPPFQSQSNPEQANKELVKEQKDVKEQFRVW